MTSHIQTRAHPPMADRPFRRRRRPDERIEILGVRVDLVRPEEMLLFVDQRIAAGQTTIVANHNLHSLHLMRRSAEMQAFYRRADLVEVDSTPMIAWARLLGRPARPFHRCTYLDWRDAFWTHAAQAGWRVFYLGSAPGVAAAGAARVRETWPEVRLAVHHGYFDMSEGAAEAQAVLDAIRAFGPQVILVGMGMPRQEAWIARHADQLPGCALFSVGAAFDYEAGVQSPAPRWMGRYGLEWLYRLARDPRRLAQRYLVEPWSILDAAVLDLWRAATRRRSRRFD